MKSPTFILIGVLILAVAGGVRAEDPRDVPAAPTSFGNTEGSLPDFIAIYDVDGSGQLSNEEQSALRRDRERHKKFRNRWDADKDGVISNTEREAAKARIRLVIEQQRRRRFAAVDTDEDGFLSHAEFGAIPAVQNSDANSPGISDSIFDHIDREPKDGRISEAEFLKSLGTPEQPKDRDAADKAGTVDTAPTSP